MVLTGDDVEADGLGDVPCHAPLNNRDGSPRHDTPRPALAIGKVRHVGQPVALVVAEALAQARDAADAIEIDYEQLPSVTDARAALEIGAPQLFNSIPGNLVFDWDNETSDFAAVDAAFAKAASTAAKSEVSLSQSNTRLPGILSNSCGAPFTRAARASVTAGKVS